MTRSNDPTVRNPLLGLPSAQRIRDLPGPARMALRAVLLDLSVDAHARAIKAWNTHKAPMACYWKCVAVYARHAARLTLPKEDA